MLSVGSRVAFGPPISVRTQPGLTTTHVMPRGAKGTPLDGKNVYKITFKAGALPPVNGFWSLTLYNEHHFFNPNPLNRYSLGTKNKNMKLNEDGSLTLYASVQSPGADQESNWLPAPEGPFSLYVRAYWGKEPILDGSWVPPFIEKIR